MGQTFGPIEGGSIGLSIDELTDLWAGRDLCLLCLVLLLINILVLKSFRFCPYYSGIAIYFATQATNSTEMYWVIFATSCFICQLLR
jgi:NHS family xanthosine MFS transporter